MKKKNNKPTFQVTIFDRIFFKAVWVGALIMFGAIIAIRGGLIAWVCSFILWMISGKELLMMSWKSEIHDEALRLFK